MRSLIMEKDWSRTSLGPPEEWPVTLRSTLSLMLACKFPMFLWWGKELLCFYNDAYRPSLGTDGRHPSLLGKKGEAAWPEIWPTIKPLIQQVLDGKGATWSEDQLIPIYRNGGMEDVYWTFSHSAVSDDEGNIVGVLVTNSESTEKMLSMQRLQESERGLHALIEHAPVAMALFSGSTHRVDLVNERALELWGCTKEQVLGLPLVVGMPQLGPSGIMEVLDDVLLTGERFVANQRPIPLMREGRLETRYINFTYEGLRGTSGNVDRILAVGTDVTATVREREEIEAREEHFRILADSMPQFVWTSDENGLLDYFNQALISFAGIASEDLMNNGWLQIVHPEDREANSMKWKESMLHGTDFLFEHRFRRNDGEYHWQLSRAVPVRKEDGSIRMWIGTSTNVQEMKEQERERDYFIGVASHEFRNPLHVLKGYLEMLLEDHAEGTDEVMSKALRSMDRQVNNLTALTNDLLDLSKLRSGAFELQTGKFDLDVMVAAIMGDLQIAQPKAKLELTRSTPVTVQGDRVRIVQVFTNLLSNALKYSPVGSPVEVELFVEGAFAVVKVRDHGIGIGKAAQERVFDRFYRVTGKDEQRFEGFGIGLYLAADIMRLHNGSIGVESELGKGSTFHFTLPLHN